MRSDWMQLRNGCDICGDAMEHDGKKPLLTPQAAECIGYAYALWLARETGTTTDKLNIAVGRDPRLSGEALLRGFVRGLTAADCDVVDCGLSTTPAVFLATVEPSLNCDGAVMVTAPGQSWYVNGFRLMTRSGELTDAQAEEILREAQSVSLPQRLVTPKDIMSSYRERLDALAHTLLQDEAKMPLLGLYVVLDAGNGSAGFYADFLRSLGAEVEGSRYLEPNGYFPNRKPDPEDPAALESLGRAVVENEADLGILVDSDGSRVSFADHEGKPIIGNRLIALISAILLDKTPGATIVTDSVTSTGLTRFITEWGGVHYRFKRGAKLLIDEAIRLNEEGIDCPLAIETGGHAAFRDNYFAEDGLYLATRLVCEAMDQKREGRPLTSLLADLAEPMEHTEMRMRILPEDYRAAGQAVIENVLSHTLEDPAWKLSTDNHEGVRITFDLDGGVNNAWIQLRMSLHGPKMALYAESDVPGGVKDILTQLYNLIKDTENLDLEPLMREIRQE